MNSLISDLSANLSRNGFKPSKLILFGSYAKGKPTTTSDIDIAVWSTNFTGNRLTDIEKIASLISKYKDVEIHPFSITDTASNNPFVFEIEKTGIDYSHLLL